MYLFKDDLTLLLEKPVNLRSKG